MNLLPFFFFSTNVSVKLEAFLPYALLCIGIVKALLNLGFMIKSLYALVIPGTSTSIVAVGVVPLLMLAGCTLSGL